MKTRALASFWVSFFTVFSLIFFSAPGAGIAEENSEQGSTNQNSAPQNNTNSATTSATAGKEGFVLVFDTSGSMDSEDSSGAVKLATAQASMVNLLRQQPGAGNLGLWQYPGNKGGCNPGVWVLDPETNPDVTDMDAQIRLLSASGDTPTGEALLAAYESLKDKGYTGATIVLVSDGEENCSISACEAAKQIVDGGFNLTVAAVAFDIADNGIDDLQCAADATGGTMTEAKNAEELIGYLAQFQKPELELSVEGPQQVLAGEHITLTATLTNPSEQPVQGASLALYVDDRAKIPYIPSPRFELPTIAPHESATRSWILGTSASAKGEANWKVAAGSPASGAAVQSGTLSLSDQPLTLDDAGEILNLHGGSLVVMGDSYSSGEGARSYGENGDADPDGYLQPNKAIGQNDFACHRSEKAYGAVIGGEDTEIIACSGAVAKNIWATPKGDDSSPQIDQLKELIADGETVGAVVLTIGGNDIGFADIVTSCWSPLRSCARDAETYFADVALQTPFTYTYEKISAVINSEEQIKARGGALAPVIVSPYPNPLWEASQGRCNLVFNTKEIEMAKELLVRLNTKIADSVALAQENGFPVYYAGGIKDFTLGHSQCESREDSYFVPLKVREGARAAVPIVLTDSEPRMQELFHPNIAGHNAWAQSLISWSQGEAAPQLEDSAALKAGISELRNIERKSVFTRQALVNKFQLRLSLKKHFQPANFDTLKLETAEQKQAALDKKLTEAKEGQVIKASSGARGHLVLADMEVGQNVRVRVFSEGQTLGVFPVGEDGTVDIEVQLPQLPVGTHHLVLSTYDAEGNLLMHVSELHIVSGFPLIVAIISGVVIFLIIVFVIVFLRRRYWKRQYVQLVDNESTTAEVAAHSVVGTGLIEGAGATFMSS